MKQTSTIAKRKRTGSSPITLLFPRLGSFLLAAVFFGTTAFHPAPVKPAGTDDGETHVFIDGVEIIPEGTITLKKDMTILLEATGLQPNSEVLFKVKKAGIKWAEESYVVNGTGTVKQLLDIPERDLTVNCTVNYHNANGDLRVAEFKLKIS